MKEILLLEDMGPIWDSFVEREKEIGDIKLHSAYQVSDAMDLFRMNKNSINWLVVDLNVPVVGLKRDEIDKSDSGRIAGWIWLENYVFPQNPEFKKRTIIFSAHIKELESYIDLTKITIEGVIIMPKANHTVSLVIQKINSIS